MNRKTSIVRFALSSSLVVVAAIFIGCTDAGSAPSSADQRQSQTLNDPMGYGGSTDKYDISGGDLRTLDKKALKKDADSVFNP